MKSLSHSGEHTAKKEMDTVNELKQYSLNIDGKLVPHSAGTADEDR